MTIEKHFGVEFPTNPILTNWKATTTSEKVAVWYKVSNKSNFN